MSVRPTIEELSNNSEFIARHIGINSSDQAKMLETLQLATVESLIAQTVPAGIRQERPLETGAAVSESAAIAELQALAKQNQVNKTYIGMGYTNTQVPNVILRNILENPAWYTAYTPYQPEISQGRLEALLNYQTMVSDLTGLEVANASLLDEATAAAEAMTMAQRVAKSKAQAFFVDENCHPQNIAVIQTRAAPLGINVIVGAPDTLDPEAVFGAVFQYPGTHGHLHDFSAQCQALHDARA